MNETLSEYLHYVVNTIIFVSAVTMFIIFLGSLTRYNRDQIESQKTKADVTMSTEYGYNDDLIYVTGNEIYTNIISQSGEYALYLNGVRIPDDYIHELKQDNPSYIQNLKSKIAFNGTYLIRYVYNDINQLTRVNYELQ